MSSAKPLPEAVDELSKMQLTQPNALSFLDGFIDAREDKVELVRHLAADPAKQTELAPGLF